MRTVPKAVDERIRYFRMHLEPFAEHGGQIGVSPEDVAELTAAVEAAEAAARERAAADAAARSAAGRMRDAVKRMSKLGALLILRVKARAGQDGDCVYALAQVRPPAKKSPLGKPGSPTAMTAELSAATGALALTWRCRQPEGSKGVLYDVWRRIGDNGAFEYLGSTGRKTFVDQTLPPGAGRVMYRIVARRSTKVGDAAEFPVNLGVSPAVAEMLRAATQDERGTARVPPAAMAA